MPPRAGCLLFFHQAHDLQTARLQRQQVNAAQLPAAEESKENRSGRKLFPTPHSGAYVRERLMQHSWGPEGPTEGLFG
jgi:hypothetical protein